ncbi:MAG: hypothetical protein LIO74_04535 [Ruminococcus sp.]|nr:hypothetical protein [Ruminococcus sp.]MCD7960030.1 hypothetical protein [Ruminococcus sp.]
MIRKRTSLTTRERKQRLFWILFGVIWLGTAIYGVLLLLQQQNSFLQWTGLMGNFFHQLVHCLCYSGRAFVAA